MDNTTARNRYKVYRPGVPKTEMKDLFFQEIGGFKSVFEFGCATGKNLEDILQLYPKMTVSGIDVNSKEVGKGQRAGRKYIAVADETHLETMADNSFELAFTSSVICHIPDAAATIEHLKRIASKKVVLIETKELHNEYYFAHDYEAHGFTIKRSLVSLPGNGCLYHQYEWEK